MEANEKFFNLYRHGFVRVAVCVPQLKVADPHFNAQQTLELIRQASEQRAILALFPELGLSGYSNEDLFFQEALLRAVQDALEGLLEATRDREMLIVVGAPLRVGQGLFNCALVLYRGRILGIPVKTYLPNHMEFYELRHFRSACDLVAESTSLCGQHDVPIGADLIVDVENIPGLGLFCELCEDVWVPVPPSCFAALAGATLIGNLSASNIVAGKDDYRRSLAANQSARLMGAYLYSAAGPGESTTDLAWDGHAMIYENGTLVGETRRFCWESQVVCADIDLDRLVCDRMRITSFGQSASVHRAQVEAFRHVPLRLEVPTGRVELQREIPRFPYVPSDPKLRDRRCFEVYNIQVHALAKRLKASGIPNLVIGVSGGIDSTQALIVAARTMDTLNLPRTNIKAYTLPGYATSDRTYRNARLLMEALGVEAGEIDIRPGCHQMMQDINHPFAEGKAEYDITFENVQAGQRTALLFRLANLRQALVVGTGDLSELALGWCTYGVGDHMSHYNVNVSVPKTLIQYLIRWVADKQLLGAEVATCLRDILDTEISPELIPGSHDAGGPTQSTEAVIGPYDLQDFTTYYITRYGYTPAKVAFLAWNAWRDAGVGAWTDVPPEKRKAYTLAEIKGWMRVFLHRFFGVSQYKRSCIPNGPKVGSGGSLSPRGDHRAPSDSEVAPWMAALEDIPEGEGG